MVVLAPGEVERGQGRLVLGVRIRPVCEQVLHAPLQARLGRVVEGR